MEEQASTVSTPICGTFKERSYRSVMQSDVTGVMFRITRIVNILTQENSDHKKRNEKVINMPVIDLFFSNNK